LGWRERGGPETLHPIGNLFLMIGAVPNTDWLRDCGVCLDRAGFVETGRDVGPRLAVSPYATCVPGVFAVGDVRSGSVKRVAAGVGAGSVVVHAVHRWLATLAPAHTLARQGQILQELPERDPAAPVSQVSKVGISRAGRVEPGAGRPVA
jgi:hypothetical protein